MECCLLCLEVNKDLLESINANSTRWQELSITEVLEKHFWPLNSIQQPTTWICLPCWQGVENFHKFYLRIEEAHMNFGRIKIEDGNQMLESKEEISLEIKDLSYCLEPEIIIDQNELVNSRNTREYSIKLEKNENVLNDCPSKDPLQKSNVTKCKNKKNSEIIVSNASKSVENAEWAEIKIEKPQSDFSDDEYDSCSYEPDKKPIEYRNPRESDKFISDNFKQMFCDICDAPFVNFTAMKKHFLQTHSIQKGYLVCCDKKFFQRTHFVDHLQYHLNPEYFKCTQCDKILSDRRKLQGHILRAHRPERITKHSCEICGKFFAMASVLRTHKLTHLPEEEKKFPCTQCGKFYASSYLLKLHTEVVHLKKQAKVCYICGKTLGSSAEYKVHMNKHEGIVINCDVCGLRLISERGLKLHKESQHPVGGKKDHPCPICDKISPTARALKKHINSMHEKRLDHKCNMCEKAFRRAESLKEHMASHTGTPLYMCPWCPKTFNSNGNMHSHRKNKHPKEYLELKLQKYN